MAKRYYIAAGIVLGLTLLAQLYFGTVYNESISHTLNILALLFVAPGLLLNHFLNLGLYPDHSAVIWLSGLVYATVSVGVVAAVQKVWKRCGQQAASVGPR